MLATKSVSHYFGAEEFLELMLSDNYKMIPKVAYPGVFKEIKPLERSIWFGCLKLYWMSTILRSDESHFDQFNSSLNQKNTVIFMIKGVWLVKGYYDDKRVCTNVEHARCSTKINIQTIFKTGARGVLRRKHFIVVYCFALCFESNIIYLSKTLLLFPAKYSFNNV